MKKDELIKDKKRICGIAKEARIIELRIRELESFPMIQDYKKLCLKISKYREEKKELETKLYWDNIGECDHYFVVTNDDYDYYEGKHNETYECLACGLTNRMYAWDDEYAKKMNYAFKKGFRIAQIHGWYINRVDYIKDIFHSIIIEYPNLSNSMIQKLIEEKEEEKNDKTKKKLNL